MNRIKNKKTSSVASIISAASLLLISIAPALIGSQAVYAANGELSSRSIEMSDSNPSAGASSVTYTVNFTTATTSTTQGVVVDFCSNSPLIATSCTAPTGFSVGTPTVTGITGLSGTWTAGILNSGRTLTLTNASGGSVTSGTAVSFNITTVTNPTSTGTFYARILTYDSSSTSGQDPASYTDTTPGTYIDGGGVALSTASVININARVQESLSFCVYIATCGDSTSFYIGHTVGNTTVIDSSTVDTSNVDFSISTNATNGAAIRLKGDTLKDGSGATLPPVGSTAAAISAGSSSADFGLCVTGGTSVSAYSPYPACSSSTYALDTTSTTGTFGEEIASLSGPVNNSISTVTYGATASNTTPAGVYTANHQLIATATF